MYPQAELNHLAQRKGDLMRRIGARRQDVVGRMDHALQPIRCVDGIYASWLQLKLMAEPSGHALNRTSSAKTGDDLSGIFRWAPLALNLFRTMR